MMLTRARTALSEQNRKNASHKHLDTPTKARIRQAYDDHKIVFSHGPPQPHFSLRSAYERMGISKPTFYRTIQSKRPGDDDRTIHNQPNINEPRGRPRAISPAQIECMERILINADVERRSMTWAALGHEAELDHVSAATIRRTMGRLDYFKCVACRRGWVNQNLAIERKAYAQIMIDRYPNKQDWWHIRFSDETHFGLGPTGRLMIIRKPGERYCHSCIQETREPNKHRGSPEAQKAYA